jgi:hypothetical protein
MPVLTVVAGWAAFLLEHDFAEAAFSLLPLLGVSLIRPFIERDQLHPRSIEMVEFTEIGAAWICIPPGTVIAWSMLKLPYSFVQHMAFAIYVIAYVVGLVTLVTLKFDGVIKQARVVEWSFRVFPLISVGIKALIEYLAEH